MDHNLKIKDYFIISPEKLSMWLNINHITAYFKTQRAAVESGVYQYHAVSSK